MKKYIVIFDSGIGGSTTFKEIHKLLPYEDYIYYCDTKNNPYGEKSDDEIYCIVKNIVNKLSKYNIKLFVIACNTATTKCIHKLRNEFKDIIFVGTEPAIKVAIDNNYKNILLMATPSTISSDRLSFLIDKYKKQNQKISLLSCPNLANAIEKNDLILVDNLLKKLFHNYLNNNFDAIVLACTHYPLIKDKINNYFKNAICFDGNIGVAKRVKFILENNNMLNKHNNRSVLYFVKTVK